MFFLACETVRNLEPGARARQIPGFGPSRTCRSLPLATRADAGTEHGVQHQGRTEFIVPHEFAETFEGAVSYVENDGPVAVDPALVVGDPDSANLPLAFGAWPVPFVE